MSHYQLAACWRLKGRLDEAIAGYRHSIELDPRFGLGYEFLAETLLRSGRFTEARTALRRGLDLVPTEEPRVPFLREKQELCERMIALDARLPALLQGRERPAAAELVELARLCREYGRPHAAAGLYAAAFAAQPSLADDMDAGHRYSAARAAAGPPPTSAPTARGPTRGIGPACAGRRSVGCEPTWPRRLNRGETANWLTSRSRTGRRKTIWRAYGPRLSLAELPAAEREEWRHLWADVDASLAADPLKQGRACRARGDWAQAADHYTRAIKEGVPDDGHFWFEYAALMLLSGDRSDYARACADMIEACGKDEARGPTTWPAPAPWPPTPSPMRRCPVAWPRRNSGSPPENSGH